MQNNTIIFIVGLKKQFNIKLPKFLWFHVFYMGKINQHFGFEPNKHLPLDTVYFDSYLAKNAALVRKVLSINMSYDWVKYFCFALSADDYCLESIEYLLKTFDSWLFNGSGGYLQSYRIKIKSHEDLYTHKEFLFEFSMLFFKCFHEAYGQNKESLIKFLLEFNQDQIYCFIKNRGKSEWVSSCFLDFPLSLKCAEYVLKHGASTTSVINAVISQGHRDLAALINSYFDKFESRPNNPLWCLSAHFCPLCIAIKHEDFVLIEMAIKTGHRCFEFGKQLAKKQNNKDILDYLEKWKNK